MANQPKLIPWLGLGYFGAVQAICIWVLFGFVPQATKQYMALSELNIDVNVPFPIRVFIGASDSFRNDWPLWIMMLAGILFLAGWMVWKKRTQLWPGLALAGVATVELGTVIALVVMTVQHLGSLVQT